MASGLKLRILSGLVLAPVTLAAIYYGGWFFMLMVMAALLMSLYEWFRIVDQAPDAPLHNFIGGLYLMICFGTYIFLRFGFEQGAWLAILVVLCVWASDIGAYVTGKVAGGPKLAPKISPNKTWAGLGGAMFFSGLALALLVSFEELFVLWLDTDLGPKVADMPLIFLAGCLLGLVGQAGDLFVSSYKRRSGVKDSGALIPGHGGLLDRIDSLILVCPFFLLLVFLWHA